MFLEKTIFSQSLSPTRSIKGYNGGDIEACEMQCTVEKELVCSLCSLTISNQVIETNKFRS